MPQIKLTLQNRISTLMIVFSLVLISVFTFIQLNNQITNITRYNSYHAILSGTIIKNNLETILKKSETKDSPGHIQKGLDILQESNIFKEASVFDKEGKIASSSTAALVGSVVRFRDLNKFLELEDLERENRWFTTEIDKLRGQLNIFIALKPNAQNPISYVAKVTFGLGNIQEALAAVYKPVMLSAIVIILLNILFGFLISKAVIGPLKMLNNITKMIASGDLTVRTRIQTNDELQELGETFNYMAGELTKMKERAENANPLTKLPGNIMIREEIEKQLKTSQKFMVVYCDLDNFKAFNDKYGIAQGDEAIKLTAEIFKEAIKNNGNPKDFIGHEGGDDFMLLTTPDKTAAVTNFIIQEFNARIRSLYSKEDLTQGYIVAHARDGSIKQFPIMTISLAGITNETRHIESYGEVTNIAAEVKKKAKAEQKSVFVLDQRRGY